MFASLDCACLLAWHSAPPTAPAATDRAWVTVTPRTQVEYAEDDAPQ